MVSVQRRNTHKIIENSIRRLHQQNCAPLIILNMAQRSSISNIMLCFFLLFFTFFIQFLVVFLSYFGDQGLGKGKSMDANLSTHLHQMLLISRVIL